MSVPAESSAFTAPLVLPKAPLAGASTSRIEDLIQTPVQPSLPTVLRVPQIADISSNPEQTASVAGQDKDALMLSPNQVEKNAWA